MGFNLAFKGLNNTQKKHFSNYDNVDTKLIIMITIMTCTYWSTRREAMQFRQHKQQLSGWHAASQYFRPLWTANWRYLSAYSPREAGLSLQPWSPHSRLPKYYTAFPSIRNSSVYVTSDLLLWTTTINSHFRRQMSP